MTVDHLAVLESEASRILAAYHANPSGRIPWSDRWTVNTVSRHVAASHYAVARIIEDRPRADFGSTQDLEQPPKADPTFPAWSLAGTEALLTQCRSVPQHERCWSPFPAGADTVGHWSRHMANETLVHRWDAEAGAGIAGLPMDPEVAADAVDEFLMILLGATRAHFQAPAGPGIHLAATDSVDEWFLDLSQPGRHVASRHPIDVALSIRATAEELLLLVYGRIEPHAHGFRVEGDPELVSRWPELLPSG
jgi:uncharacterized protein (TIGR03083 family)